mmetsp:Transcript_17846/g.40424  ORF Transcript_17846/g.40424 Transcript_17846/m.40424 type:complete len:273 (-) Transcript_17846:242-1060(-)
MAITSLSAVSSSSSSLLLIFLNRIQTWFACPCSNRRCTCCISKILSASSSLLVLPSKGSFPSLLLHASRLSDRNISCRSAVPLLSWSNTPTSMQYSSCSIPIPSLRSTSSTSLARIRAIGRCALSCRRNCSRSNLISSNRLTSLRITRNSLPPAPWDCSSCLRYLSLASSGFATPLSPSSSLSLSSHSFLSSLPVAFCPPAMPEALWSASNTSWKSLMSMVPSALRSSRWRSLFFSSFPRKMLIEHRARSNSLLSTLPAPSSSMARSRVIAS